MPFVIEGEPYESDVSIGADGDLSVVTAVRGVRKIGLSALDPDRDRLAVVMETVAYGDSSLLFQLKSRDSIYEPYLALDAENSGAVALYSLTSQLDAFDPDQLDVTIMTVCGSIPTHALVVYIPITLRIVSCGQEHFREMTPYVGSNIRLESHTLD